MNRKLNKKGVTLIELVVVMVIIALGAVMMVPNIGRWLPNYRLRSAARDITSILRSAQMKAVSNNREYRVSFTEGTGNTGSYILERDSGGFAADSPAQALPPGIQMTTNFNNDRVTFKTNSAADAGGTVVLQNPQGTQRRITVALSTGRITIQ